MPFRKLLHHILPGQRQGAGTAGVPSPDITSYPSVDPGMPASSIDEILESNKDLVDRLKLSYGATREVFERDVLQLVRRYAEYVHLLPATPDNYFNGPGGLLRMGLETGFFALQATDGQIFSGRTTIAKRHVLEPRWKLATFVAGLCNEIHRTLSHVIVADERGEEWPGYLQPLGLWLTQGKRTRYFVRWVPNAPDMRSLGVFALPHIASPAVLQELSMQNTVVVPHMLASVTGMPIYREHNVLEEVVRRAAALVIDRDLRARADRYGKPQIGSHLEQYLVDALRRLVGANTAWRPNEGKSRIWYDSHGLYVVWPNAAGDIRKLLDADCLPGIPKAPETILEILIAAGVVEPRDAAHATWTIYPPNAETSVEAIKLSSPMIVLATMEQPPEPLALDLTAQPKQVSKPEKKEAPAKKGPSEPVKPKGCAEEKATAMNNDGQLKLAIEDRAAVEIAETQAEPQLASAPAEPHEKPDVNRAASVPVSIEFELEAPMRLNPTVRDALSEVVRTLNGTGEALACTTSEGVFVPVSALQRGKLDTALVIRALADCDMLTRGDGAAATSVRDFGGNQVCGVTLKPGFVRGLDVRDFVDGKAGQQC